MSEQVDGMDSDGAGDSLYSTAPSSPELAPSRRRESYDEALRKSDLLAQEPHVINSKPDEHHAIKLSDSFSGQSPPVPKHVGSQGKTKGVISPLLDSIPQPPIPEVISANPVHVQVGFQAPDVGSNSLETTALSSLPGTVDVITSPPMLQKQQPSQAQHIPPSSLSRPRSIEEIDQERRNYVPTVLTNKKKPVLYQEREAGFCLDLATLTGYVAPTRPLDFVEPEIFDPVIEGEPSSSKLRSLSFELKDVLHENEQEASDTSSITSHSEELYAEFLKSQTCYQLIPSSSKLVVFDTRLRVKKAFFALVTNGVRSAPLWDSEKNMFVGMLTITDFINILRRYYKSPIVGMDELEEQTIQTWRVSEKAVANINSTLIQIDPLESLYEAVKVLIENKIHRLPVIDSSSGNVLYIITHKRVLHYMYCNLMDEHQPQFMQKSLQELGIGSYKNIATATSETPIITAINKFTDHRISALPIVDSEGKVKDIYAKFDVINLAAERTYNNLDVSLRDALKHRANGFEGVLTCLPTDTLEEIIKKIVESKVHRLVIVNEERHAIGVLSLSDILRFLVLTPHFKKTN